MDKKLINRSFERCINSGMKANQIAPKYISKVEFKKRVKKNRYLIKVFQEEIIKIKNKFNYDLMFILTDAEAIVIAYDKTNYFNEKEKGTVHIEGLDFSEKSCGTNAISLSMETNGQVELKKEGHFNEKFKQWSCYAFPLYIEKDIIGYLNIASIKTKLKCEFKIIFELVANQILNELKKENTKEKSLLTRTQIDIIKKVSEGYTEKRIAYELHLSQDTIKYHKRRIYNKLNVQSSSQAVMECCRLGILSK